MLRNNNSLKAIQENRSAAGYEIDRAKAGYGPRVDLTARGGFGKLTDSTTRSYNYDEAAPYSSASLLVTQPLWDGWLTRGRVREAEATYRSLDHRVMDNANSLALDAIIAHVDVLRRQQIYQLAQDNVSRHEENSRQGPRTRGAGRGHHGRRFSGAEPPVARPFHADRGPRLAAHRGRYLHSSDAAFGHVSRAGEPAFQNVFGA